MEFTSNTPHHVRCVVGKLAGLLRPSVIYLYNQRFSASGDTTSFKLCVVASLEDKQEAERKVYMEIDCDIPFDLLLYTPEEWRDITGREGSFAGKILTTGKIVYGEAL